MSWAFLRTIDPSKKMVKRLVVSFFRLSLPCIDATNLILFKIQML